ncbi:SM/Sec1-family protein [Coccomyxa subellipsoidea C-169]|uniref:SM/Sec1-family protein n=1 Tax=Coccomyxa subellipsoidea (strain C-169) TaxID=574566 RepID=I0Z9V8_COCSC|nr:SM/Sec1-family protein [Coccomyxa subellipsoidea C-169]EIE27427.1 SM/Sec1-family protein [Coccomyxa subellipsoidea C-169]|eukprot:XP_005651971.1 SM/Sec1-family protein [Coccomyxa subellipsoidea C-169]
MDLSTVIRFYIEKMLKDVKGMKALLLDTETTRIVSTVYSQSEILEQEVYLVEKLDADPGEQLLHLKAVCFLRPTRENVARLRKELRSPRYGDYHLFFTNRIEDLRLQDLAEVDLRETVFQVQEFFGDFAVLDPHHFAVPVLQNHVTLQPFTWDYGRSTDAVARMTEGLASLMLSLRRRFAVRYQKGSEMCEKLAQSLHHLTTSEERELFDFGKRGGEVAPIVLLLDRKEDPVTPLLLQWTYQAMVHELIGINTNRVDLTHVPGVKKDFQEIVLSARQDEFYRKHMYANFGDIGAAVKDLVDEFQKQSTSSRNINTIEDMQNFVENFSEFSAAQRNTGKHVTLMSELSRLVDARTLMQVSSVEQEVCCSTGNLMGHYEAVRDLINSPHITDDDRMRLVMLFALRYERDGQTQLTDLLQRLQDFGLMRQQLGLVRTLLAHAGADKRIGDLFSNRSFSSRFATMAKHSLRGVENVYTQHTPLLINTLEALIRGRLKDTDFPYIDKTHNGASPAKLIVVFIVGGTTYEEARALAELNAQGERNEGWSAGVRILLGGTGVLNSKSFMDNLMAFMALN